MAEGFISGVVKTSEAKTIAIDGVKCDIRVIRSDTDVSVSIVAHDTKPDQPSSIGAHSFTLRNV